MRKPPLKAFLEDPARPDGTLHYHELQGFLFAVASAPELIRPSEWMPVIFDDHEAGYASLDEAKAVLSELMQLYNAVNAAVGEGRGVPPRDCAFRRPALANLDEDAPISQWSRGFVTGHQWLEDLWESYVPKTLDEEFAAMLLTLSFFSSRTLAEAFLVETDQTNLEAMAKEMRRIFPGAAAEYGRLGRTIHDVLQADRGAGARAGSSEKTGRNAQCPCGSGRKYKRCCGASA